MRNIKHALLALKETDIRLDTIRQCVTAVDRGIHIGGAYSAIIPLTALFYGGYIEPDVENPTNADADLFILSKGHAVAPLAAIYADLGYFSRTVLDGSRSYHSILNGHPGPILPGMPVSTGPLGHGISISCGFAANRPGRDIYCMAGDGELQEGSNWEGILYAAEQRLDNLCVLVDRNHGQSDNLDRLVVDVAPLAQKFEAFGWRAIDVDGTSLEAVCGALEAFRSGPRDGRPTALVLDTCKGYGGAIAACRKHKVTLGPEETDFEIAHLKRARAQRLAALVGAPVAEITVLAVKMNYMVEGDAMGRVADICARESKVLTKRAAARDKRLRFDASAIPSIKYERNYLSDDIVKMAMQEMARDPRVISVDADLSNTSGLQPAVAQVDVRRALNAGIAEAHMMNLSEAYAADGCNVWNSTFAVFYDCRAFRRIAVSQQERMESIAHPDGWLAPGHGLDITFLATAPNLETQVNGATHMGNDDILVYGEIAHLKPIDICCPQQLVSAMKWIAAGNRGLVYLRIPRMPFSRIYGDDYTFEYGEAAHPFPVVHPEAYIVSSGRGVVEALKAGKILAQSGTAVEVIDMPSVDEKAMIALAQSGKPVWFCEQNNGFLYARFARTAAKAMLPVDFSKIHAINCCDEYGRSQFIHSGTYQEIVRALGLEGEQIAQCIGCID